MCGFGYGMGNGVCDRTVTQPASTEPKRLVVFGALRIDNRTFLDVLLSSFAGWVGKRGCAD